MKTLRCCDRSSTSWL